MYLYLSYSYFILFCIHFIANFQMTVDCSLENGKNARKSRRRNKNNRHFPAERALLLPSLVNFLHLIEISSTKRSQVHLRVPSDKGRIWIRNWILQRSSKVLIRNYKLSVLFRSSCLNSSHFHTVQPYRNRLGKLKLKKSVKILVYHW